MVPASSDEMPHNPFATQYVRPGAIPFLFPPAQSATTVVQQLKSRGWRGEICGPHGTGKSTLLHSLRAEMLREERELIWYELRQGGHRLPRPNVEKSTHQGFANSQTLLIVDGAEQLTWWERKKLLWASYYVGAGVLWTTHRPLGLPLIWKTEVDLQLAQQVVRQLVFEADDQWLSEEVATAWAANENNLRETLFTLFDSYQRRM